ncbi:hypothetical protein [Pantoea allii]|uniref:hypothetical protein n=1 Tax=Pantoea allii TaxID=574096 RepID=UPI000A22BB73|nr:hypothetical protein [Pantoea allii]MBW1254521.1 hypothetical protein [Pantoea allii]MBW1263502.1 hypothetical protein [Pantoea allii]MBW1285717.1 hypothetical protein [Pantoea allii]ORM86919.1 hypothetical protein HA38_06665 [Pantoea allii]PBK02309.1 hypothetical protein CMR03_00140 [Pantoea allii]
MKKTQEIINEYSNLSRESQFEFLREFDQKLDLELAEFFLKVVENDDDDDIRIEAVKVLGLYKGDYDDYFIRKSLISIIKSDETEDDSLIVNCINTLSLLDIGKDEIIFASKLIKGDSYILFKSAAFDLLKDNKDIPEAFDVIKSLVDDKEYGKAAKRVVG